MTDFEGPAPNASFEVTWLQPYPDALLDESPEASVERAETGYADQPHLTRECAELTGLPPAALLASRRTRDR